MSIIRETTGYCPCCNQQTKFIATEYWLRDFYRCQKCGSIPRNRALMYVLKKCVPDLKEKKIHESSPTDFLKEQRIKEYPNYSYSYFYPNLSLGQTLDVGNASNQNLEKITFEDNTFDVFITEDVMEHVFRPIDVYKEIYRVLKRGGVYIFTTPIYLFSKTRARVKWDGEKWINILPEIYHGNPIDKNGSLVTYDWGDDIASFIDEATGFNTEIIQFPHTKENFEMGLEADFLQVVICKKE